jgi:adenylate cyclase class 2
MKSPGNYEVEIKLRVADRAGLLRNLRRLRARVVRRVHELNTLYDTASRDLGRSGRLLRLRLEAPLGLRAHSGAARSSAATGIITFKSPVAGLSQYKVRRELEIPLPDPRNVEKTFEAMGFRPWFRYEKRRTRYRLPGFSHLQVDFDETPIGLFIELEGKRTSIDRAARALGYGHKDYLTANYWALYCEDCRLRGRPIRDMLFPRRKK